jgi:hypothetical protein
MMHMHLILINRIDTIICVWVELAISLTSNLLELTMPAG